MESKRNNISNYLSKWLVTILGDRTSSKATEFPLITKKVRDEVLESFQRSDYWMTIKVLLQLNLTNEFDQIPGRFIYKLIILKFLTSICTLYNRSDYETLNIDLLNQMLTKLARRIEKLTKNCDTVHPFSYNHIIDETKAAISKTRHMIDLQIAKLVVRDVRQSQLAPLAQLKFEVDVVQKVPKLMEYIRMRGNKHERQKYDGKIRSKKFARHHYNTKRDPGIEFFDKINDEIESNLYLSDYENWLLYVFTLDEGMNYAPSKIRRMFFQYSSKAEAFYKNDPIGSSRMLLFRLKLLVILDMIATREYPLLLKHRTGINTCIFDCLLLPQFIDMQIALELQAYFTNRNSNASYPALIEENIPSTQSFAVMYAETNAEMQAIRQAIQRKADNEIEMKRAEHRIKKSEAETLKLRAESMTCDYYTNHRKGFTAHDRYCKLCALKRQIKKITILSYERPLPDDVHLQNAIVFELRIPVQIACLRDVMYEVVQLLSNKSHSFYGGKNNVWVNYHQISMHNQPHNYFERVRLESTSSLNLSVSYKQERHVDYPFELFILSNGYNCRYQSSGKDMPTQIEEKCVKKLCTLKVESESPYENLQWTLEQTTHTQNQVLAKQSDCSIALSLSEYKNFGSLRADGHRLQLRKLYGMIEAEALSFETSSVLALIMQTIWETGPCSEYNRVHRESHEDFNDVPFTLGMIKMLEKFITKQKNNWNHPFKLLITALLAVRVFELNTDELVADQIVKILQKLRELTIDWMAKIQTAIREMHKNNSSEISLRDKLIDVSIAGAITFFVHFQHKYFNKIFVHTNGISAMRIWLEIIVTLNNNHLLNSNECNVKAKHHNLLRLVRNIGISVESIMWQFIKENPTEVHDFIKKQWSQANDGNFCDFQFIDDQAQFIVPILIENERNDVLIDIITGEFEVNNQPVAKLSLSIAKTVVFERVFQQFAFEVQPGEPNHFTTIQKYRNCSYKFWAKPNSDVIITERRMNGIIYELLPHIVLTNEIPYLLVENHSHWWNKTNNIIDRNYLSTIDLCYLKVLNMN